MKMSAQNICMHFKHRYYKYTHFFYKNVQFWFEPRGFLKIQILRPKMLLNCKLSVTLPVSKFLKHNVVLQLCDSAHVHKAASQTSKWAVVYFITLTG